MTKKMKKLTAMLLAGMLVTQGSMSVMAMNVSDTVNEQSYLLHSYNESARIADKLGNIWAGIASDYERFDLTKSDVKQPILGNAIPVYSITENGIRYVDYTLYPILNTHGEIIALCTVVYQGDEFTLQIEKGYADTLSEIVDIHGDEFALFYDNDSLYACFEEGNPVHIRDLPSALRTNYFIPENYMESMTLSDYSLNQHDIEYDHESNQASVARTIYRNYCNVPIYYQATFGLCWASAVASIGSHMTGINLTAMGIADQMGIDYDEGGTLSQAAEALSRFYNFDYVYIRNRALTYDTLKDYIDSDIPLYIYLDSPRAAHAVVGDGYYYNTSSSDKLIRMMDSNEDYYVSTTFLSNGGFNYTAGNTVFTQERYITIDD